ncbi:Coenzyme F420 hydrogenase/dehydrogenase, beta subunit C-terminal domain [Bacteroides caecigallinarum]|nr:Coenzyme F420 hydrogenase/dehydrogenase, beta subunit C-terminal domain [Bacteroides caecigallinarum]
MINITNKVDCCGCTACASICPHKAITMKPDTLGFLYPEVDTNKCTYCGLCEKVCSFNPNYDKSLNFDKPEAYGARHKDIKEVETSRSGAAFIAISDWILENGGVVYGVGYKDHFRVAHKRAVTKTQRNEFKGSKYVQSDLGDIFIQVKKDLRDGKIVLFSGTPCQTSGLNSFIGKKYRQNLYLVDIVCHCVPSPYIWRDYISYYERKYKKRIVSVDFRDKKLYGWHDHKETFILDNGLKINPKYNPFTELFYKHIMLRQSCGNCHFCNTTRPSDITIADFWGWEKTNPEFNKDDKGVSLLLINTEKGKELFETINDKLYTFQAKLEDCLQPNLRQPTTLHPLSDKFTKDYAKYGFKYIILKYTNLSTSKQIRIFITKVKNKLRSCIIK